MVSTSVLELAKQGNVDAIASLINYQLQSQDITAKVNLQDNCIYVLFLFQKLLNLLVEE